MLSEKSTLLKDIRFWLVLVCLAVLLLIAVLK